MHWKLTIQVPVHPKSQHHLQDVKCVKALLDTGADVIALLKALNLKNFGCVDLLLKARADVNIVSRGTTPIIAAAAKRNEFYSEYLVKAGAKLDVKDKSKETPLIKAVESGLLHCVQVLIQAGANLNRRNKDEMTPLIATAESDQKQCLNLLIKAGADVSAVNYKNYSALLKAAGSWHNDQCVDSLLKAGASVKYMSHFAYWCKMRCPLNLVLENSEYLWFY